MPRKYPTRRLTLDVLEPRTLMSTGLADDIWRNAQPHVAVAAIHASGTPAAEVAHAQNSAKVAVTQQHGRGGAAGTSTPPAAA